MTTLDGLKAIAAYLDLTRDKVRALQRAGAPIRVLYEGRGRRYLADGEALRAWLRCEQPASSAD